MYDKYDNGRSNDGEDTTGAPTTKRPVARPEYDGDDDEDKDEDDEGLYYPLSPSPSRKVIRPRPTQNTMVPLTLPIERVILLSLILIKLAHRCFTKGCCATICNDDSWFEDGHQRLQTQASC
jgi:hypothetical protein